MVGGEALVLPQKEHEKNLSFESLRGFEKAAILLNYLGPDTARVFFRHMEDEDLQKLLAVMPRFQVVPTDLTRKVLEEFYEMLTESRDHIFSAVPQKTVIEAVGEERAHKILSQISMVTPKTKALDSLEEVDPRWLSNFLQSEHPQTIAVILTHLDPRKRGSTLLSLPEGLQDEVVVRLANLDYFVAPELISEIDQALQKEIPVTGARESEALGGVSAVVEMLKAMDKTVESSIINRVRQRDSLLADQIHHQMFVFEDLVRMDDWGIQELLRRVNNDQLQLALKVASEAVKEKIFNNISQRARGILEEDLEQMGPSKLSDVEAAQEEIVSIVRDLERSGEIFIAREAGEDILV